MSNPYDVPNPYDANSDDTEVIPRVDPAAESGAGRPKRGVVIAAGAATAALVLGGLGGYLIGSAGSSEPTTVAAPTTGTSPTSTAPAVGPGRFLAATGTVEAINGTTFVLVTADGVRLTVGTGTDTRIITLNGSESGDLKVGDAAVVQGGGTGPDFAAELVIAGALPGLMPTTAAPVTAVVNEPGPVPVVPQTQRAAVPAVTPVPATRPPVVPPPAAATPTPPQREIGPKQDSYGPKQDSYGPKQDSYGPKQDSYGPN